MGKGLERAKFMPLEEIKHTLQVWRKLGGSKLSILGGNQAYILISWRFVAMLKL